MHQMATGILACMAFISLNAGELSAQEVWDEAIRAKGGRERLHQVRSIVVSATANWGIRGINHVRVDHRILFVPPSCKWEWADQRPSRFGLWVRVVNLAKNYAQMTYHVSDSTESVKPSGVPSPKDRADMQNLEAVLFMEERFFQPKVIKVRNSFERLTPVYVVSSELSGRQFEWRLNKKTYLPMKVTITESKYSWEFSLSDYRDVDGIMLPHKIAEREDLRPIWAMETVEYQVNVDYEELLFHGPPSIAAGPTGWRRSTPEVLQERNLR